jgi:2-polyprenyl-6-methoxyphenol hydroxylase-like FAD-dependent oxidoreductase
MGGRLDSQRSAPTFGHAIVVGGSITGLIASRVLSDHFERVTLIERDPFPGEAVPRKGLPQARHLHLLLVRGRQVVEQLFPGIGDELVAEGADVLDAARDIAWLTPAGWGTRFRSGICSFACSRSLLDHVLRRRVSSIGTISVKPDTDVVGLRFATNDARVTGVVVTARGAGAKGGGETVMDADLVVDASGRRSRTPEWLAHVGFDRPEETVVNAHLGYASRVYKRPTPAPADWKCLYVQAAPPERTRGGVAFAIEGGRWIVTLGGIGGDYPPTDEPGFLSFMGSLASREVFDAVAGAEPLSSIAGFRATENRWRHYERLSRRPEGLVVMGDAACTFNPVYGQGMTLASLAAVALGERLRYQRERRHGSLSGLAARFQRDLARINKAPWLLATSEDFRSPRFDGARPGLTVRLMHGYLDRVIARTTCDEDVRKVFLSVLHMIDAPAALFRPAILAKALLRPRRMDSGA